MFFNGAVAGAAFFHTFKPRGYREGGFEGDPTTPDLPFRREFPPRLPPSWGGYPGPQPAHRPAFWKQ